MIYKILIFSLISLGTIGIFFIRNDNWWFGVDGTILSLIGLSGILFAVLFIGRKKLFSLCVSKSLFYVLLYLLVTFFIIFFNLIVNLGDSADLFLLREFIIVLLVLFSGFAISYYFEVKPSTVIMLSIPWFFSASFLMLEHFAFSHAIRRVDVLASVNYVSSSLSFISISSVLTLNYLFRLKPKYYLIYLLLATFVGLISILSLFLTGSRSAFLSILLFYFIVIFYNFKNLIFNFKISLRSFRTFIFTLLFLIILIGIGYFIFSNTKSDLSLLISRFNIDFISDSTEGRLSIWLSSIPTSIIHFLLGDASLYFLYSNSPDAIHPHNHFLSIIRFTGVFTFLIFLMLSYQLLKDILTMSNSNINIMVQYQALLIFSGLIVFGLYSLVSGHFTRSWHLYFIIGLAIGYISHIKKTY